MLKPLKKPKKKPKLSYYQNKTDKLLQEIFVKNNPYCLICGAKTSCGHHFVKKSQSTALRYNIKNLIPVCQKCHCSIHTGLNDMVVGKIVALKGVDWLAELEFERKKGIGLKYGIVWYKEQLRRMSLLTPYKPK